MWWSWGSYSDIFANVVVACVLLYTINIWIFYLKHTEYNLKLIWLGFFSPFRPKCCALRCFRVLFLSRAFLAQDQPQLLTRSFWPFFKVETAGYYITVALIYVFFWFCRKKKIHKDSRCPPTYSCSYLCSRIYTKTSS